MCVVDISNVDGCCMLTSVTIKNSMLLILDDEFLLRCCCLLINNGNDSRCVLLFGDVFDVDDSNADVVANDTARWITHLSHIQYVYDDNCYMVLIYMCVLHDDMRSISLD